MNKVLSGILAVGVVASLAAGAHAQGSTAATTTTKVVKPISVKIGGLWFGNSDTKDAIGSSTISLGIGYDFMKTKAENPVVLQGYLDYFLSKDGTVNVANVTQETKMDYAYGVGVAARYQLVKATDTASVFPYAGLGLGVYGSKFKSSTTTDNGEGGLSVVDDSGTKTGLGGKIFIGAEMKQGFLGELEYNWMPDNGPIKPSGFGLRVGYRF
jgi:hypothetical protein